LKSKKENTTKQDYYMYKDRKITCTNYSLESAAELCKVCSNRTYCRESRRVIKVRLQIAEEYNRKNKWRSFIKEVKTPRETSNPLFEPEQKKEPTIPFYQKEENILKLNWDGYYARAHTPKKKSGGKGGRSGRKSNLSANALKQIRYGNVPTLKMEI